MHRTTSRGISFFVILTAIILSPIAASSVEASPGGNGALLSLTDQTIHVVWQFDLEYDSSEMVDEVDSLHEALRYNDDRTVETQLESLITETLKKANENLVCKNSKILLETDINTWVKILLEFDVEGAITLEGDYLIVDMSWRELTVKGKVRITHDRIEHSFYPRKSLGLEWPFGSDLNNWSVDHSVQQSKVVSTSFTNVYDQGVEIIPDVTLKPVNMTITVPGSATAERNYIKVPRDSSGTTSTEATYTQTGLYVGLGIVSLVGFAVLLGIFYLRRLRESSIETPIETSVETPEIKGRMTEAVHMKKAEVCPMCDGKGELFCTTCHGTGRVNSKECPACDGTGRKKCPVCNSQKEF